MRNLINIFRNSKLHAFIVSIMQKMEMEGFTISFSQGGEDLIIKKLLHKTQNGFYVDIGCNNPIQKSNTYKLYLKGWKGICIDGNASLIKQYKKIRPKDTTLCEIISNEKKEFTFYQVKNNHEFSTIDRSTGQSILASNKDVEEINVVSKTLEEIFDTYTKDITIDLLCVDVEHHDLQVLQGNNFSKYRPRFICVESPGDFDNVSHSPITTFLKSKNYKIRAFCSENIFFEDNLRTTQ